MSTTSNAYERSIQVARICTAIVFAISGLGFAVCVNLQAESGARVCGIAMLASIASVVLLIAEQLFAAWFATRRGRISLAALMIMMTASGVFFAVLRNSVSLAFVLLTLTLTLISAELENRRRPSSSKSDVVQRKCDWLLDIATAFVWPLRR